MEHTLPQLDLSTYPTQILWTFLAFIILYLLIQFVFVPRIVRPINRRRLQLLKSLRKVKALKNAVNDKREEYLRHQQFLQTMRENRLNQLINECKEKVARENAEFDDKVEAEMMEQQQISRNRLNSYHQGEYDNVILTMAETVIENMSCCKPEADELSQMMKRIRQTEN